MSSCERPESTVEVAVQVQFRGAVTVAVPTEIPEECRGLAAESWALAQILATLDNEDAPQEEAYEHYLGFGGKAVDEAWEKFQGTISGEWEIDSSIELLPGLVLQVEPSSESES